MPTYRGKRIARYWLVVVKATKSRGFGALFPHNVGQLCPTAFHWSCQRQSGADIHGRGCTSLVAARALPAWYPACAARVVPTWYPACEQGMPQPGPSLRSKSGATQTDNQCRNRRRQSTIQATSNAIILKSDNQPTAVNFSHSLQTPPPFPMAE